MTKGEGFLPLVLSSSEPALLSVAALGGAPLVHVLLAEGWQSLGGEREASRLRAVVKLLEVRHPQSPEHPVLEVEP